MTDSQQIRDIDSYKSNQEEDIEQPQISERRKNTNEDNHNHNSQQPQLRGRSDDDKQNNHHANNLQEKDSPSTTSSTSIQEYNPHSLKLDILSSTLILCMSTLFLVATTSMKQKQYILNGSYKVASFFLSTSITYAAFVVIELYKRNDVGTYYILMAIMGIPASVSWMIGSCYLLKSHFDYLKFGLCWSIGALLDLCFCISKHLYQSTWFLKFSLMFVTLANGLIIVGVSIMMANYNTLYRVYDCEKRLDDMDHFVWVCWNQDLDWLDNHVSLKRFYTAMDFMIAASIFYILYACFYILHMFVDRGIGAVAK